MLELILKRFEDALVSDILNADNKYDEIVVDGDEGVVLFKRNSYRFNR